MMKLRPEGRVHHLRRVLQARATLSTSAENGARIESVGASSVSPDDVLHHVDSVLQRLPADEVGDPAEFRKALQTLMQHAEPALKKVLAPEPPSTLAADEEASLEALIIPDGSRPSFLLREGQIAADHPFLGTWEDDMKVFQPALRKLAACVGRIQLPGGGPASYSGTGTLVDVAHGLVLTNFHVVNHARNNFGVRMEPQGTFLTHDKFGVRMQPQGTFLKVLDDWVIDFAGESGIATRNRWRINQVRVPAKAGESFAGLDAAVLRIEPFDAQESTLPAPVIVLSSDADYASGAASRTLVTIGFPGQPDTTMPPGATVDWNFVIGTLFNNRFGLKRVAPGEFRDATGTVKGDKFGHVLTHDATTFGGASGSLVFAWKNQKKPAFALHFAGATLSANYAVSLHEAANALRALGLHIE